MGIPGHLICLLTNLFAGQKETAGTEHGTIDWSKSGKEYVKAVYCHLASLTYMQSTSWEMLDWVKHTLESRLPGEISVMPAYTWHHPYCRKWRRTEESLDENERGEWKIWLKTQHLEYLDHGIWFHHFVANRWENSENSKSLYFFMLQNHCIWSL